MNGFQLCNTADSVVTSSRERKIRSAATAVPRRSDQNSYPGRDLCSIRRERKTLSRTSPRLFFGFQTIVPPWDMADRFSLSLSLSLSDSLSLSFYFAIHESCQYRTASKSQRLGKNLNWILPFHLTINRRERRIVLNERQPPHRVGALEPWDSPLRDSPCNSMYIV